MVSLVLLLGCNLSYIVGLFAALHQLASASARTLLKLASSVRARLKPYGATLNWICYFLLIIGQPHQYMSLILSYKKLPGLIELADFLSGDFIRFHVNSRARQTEKYFNSVQQAWTEKISLAFRTNISIFSSLKEQLALGVHLTITAPKFFPTRTKFKVYFPRTYFFYCRCLCRANNLIDVFGMKDKICHFPVRLRYSF